MSNKKQKTKPKIKELTVQCFDEVSTVNYNDVIPLLFKEDFKIHLNTFGFPVPSEHLINNYKSKHHYD